MQLHLPSLRHVRVLVLSQVCAAFAVSVTLAQLAPSTSPATPTRAQLARYDVNKNGVLDPNELAALQADVAKSAAPTTATTAAQGDVVQLTPFEVSASGDVGYLASNTLSGTRLNSKISDLASSITVVTKEQMLDFAALDINDIFLYEANTEGTATFTNSSVGRNGVVDDFVQRSPQTSNRIRGLDTANTARNNFSTNNRIAIDPYNTEAVEISRGPNSNIFGLGNAAGTVNTLSSQAKLDRSTSQIATRVDNFDGYRVSADFNRPLIKGKVALRVLALRDDKGFALKPSADITRRYSGLLTLRPFSTTTFRAGYESYDNFARRPNALTPRDTVTAWKAAGSPTWDPTNFTAYRGTQSIGVFAQSADATLPVGLFTSGTGIYNRPSMFIDNGAVQLWMVNRTATTNNPNSPNTNVRYLESGTTIMRNRDTTMPLFAAAGVTDKSLYDWSNTNFVAPNYSKGHADIYTAELEQTFLSSGRHLLAAQLGFHREDVDYYNRNFINGGSAVLFVDVNQKLLDGRPNPYFLRPYIGASEPGVMKNPELADNGRAQIAYQLDLSREKNLLRWVGRHRLVAYGEMRKITNWTYRLRDTVLDRHLWTSATDVGGGSAAGRAFFRYYVGDNQGQNVDYSPPALYGTSGTYPFYYLNGATGQWVNENAVFGETGYVPTTATQREVRTQGLVAQSFLLSERVVATLGWRRDRNRSRDSASVLGADGFVDNSPLNRDYGRWTEAAGPTRTTGVVARPFVGWGMFQANREPAGAVGGFLHAAARSLSVQYNQADSFVPASAAYTPTGGLLPNPTGSGKDYGVSFNLFGEKLVARINRYDTTQLNARFGGTAGRLNTMDFNGAAAGSNLEDHATVWVATLHPTWTAAQQRQEVYRIMGLPEGFIENVVGKTISDTRDVASKGWEFELNYNPNRHLTIKVTGAKQRTIDTHISPESLGYAAMRLPVWTTVINPVTGNLWWNERANFSGDGTPSGFYQTAVVAQSKIDNANEGKPRSQVREWRWNALISYKLAGISDHKWLKNTTVGGAARWEDKASIGYLGTAPDADGVIRSLDPTRPVFDKARTYFDAFITHNLTLGTKVRTRLQLNVRNAFEGGRLQTVGINPDGSPYNFRIVEPRQIIFSTTFDL